MKTNTNTEAELYLQFRRETDPVKKFNLFLEIYCKDDYAHLIDSDDNAGEFMRKAIDQYVHQENTKARIDELESLNALKGETVKVWAMEAYPKILGRISELQASLNTEGGR